VSKLTEGALLQPNNKAEVVAESSTNAAEMGEVFMRSAKLGPGESKSSVRPLQTEKSRESFGLTALTSCLVDADGSTTAVAGRERRKALGVSALIQFCTLTAILIVPLFATGSRLILRPTNFVPLPPYGGAPRQAPANTQRQIVPTIIHDAGHRFEYHPQVQAPTQRQAPIEQNAEDYPLGNTDAPKGLLGLPGTGNGTGDMPGLLPGEPNGSRPPAPASEPTTAPTARKPITVSQGVQLALLTHRVEPIYPMFAKQQHREGTVELRAIISTDGTVKDVQVLSGDPVLARAAQEAVAQWRFRPTMLNGVAVEVISFFTVNFHIDH
jgi:periplasmic protein TonB